MTFGEPYKYVELTPTYYESETWDENLENCDNKFLKEEHHIFL